MGGGAMFGLAQTAYWGRNDNGTEITATGKAVQKTNWSQDVDENFRVRFVLQETGGAAGTTGTIQLQYQVGGTGGWSNVDDVSSVVRSSASPNFTDNQATTNHASITGSGTFVAGSMDQVNGLVNTVSLGASGHTEVEFCVQIVGADVINGTLVGLRINTTTTNAPLITVIKAVPADLVIQDSTHAHSADNLALTQAHSLEVAEALHTHNADDLGLEVVEGATNLGIRDALHAHTAGDFKNRLTADQASFETSTAGWTITGAPGFTDVGRVADSAPFAHGGFAYEVREDGGTAVGAFRGIRTNNTVPAVAGDVWSVSGEAKAMDASAGHARTIVRYLNAALTPLVTHEGVNVSLTQDVYARATLTTPAAPANTAFIDAQMVYRATGVATRRCRFDKIQVEEDSSVTTWALSGDITLVQESDLAAIQDASHGHTADNVELFDALVIQDAAHAHSADALTLVQRYEWSDPASDTTAAASGADLVIAAATHAHTADNLALTQAHSLVVADALHAHSADNVTFSVEGALEIQDAAHAHTAESPTLTQLHALGVQGATHAHAADQVAIVAGATVLIIADALHGHTAGALALVQTYNLAVEDSTHSHTAESLLLSQLHILLVADALHAHSAESLFFEIWSATPRRSTVTTARRSTTGTPRRETVATERRG
jgi:hypothetical protein